MERKSIRVQAHENDFLAGNGRLDYSVRLRVFPSRDVHESIAVLTGRGLTNPMNHSLILGAEEMIG
jgi:hypothetical protein